jgi:hypothetical protein
MIGWEGSTVLLLKPNKIVKKSKFIIFLFIVLTLVSSSSISTFVTGGGINAAYASKHSDSSSGDSGGSSDGGGGGSDDNKKDKKSSKDSSPGSGGGSSSPLSDSSPPPPPTNADTNNDNNPAALGADNTAAGGEQNQGQTQTASPDQQEALQGTLTLAPAKRLCPEGQSFDTSIRQCLSNPPPTEPTPEATTPPQPPIGGSTTAQLNNLPTTTLTPTSPKTPCSEGMIFDPKIGHCLPISEAKTRFDCLVFIFNCIPIQDAPQDQDPGLPPCDPILNPCGQSTPQEPTPKKDITGKISPGLRRLPSNTLSTTPSDQIISREKSCPEGQHFDSVRSDCIGNAIPLPDKNCVPGYHMQNVGCVKDIIRPEVSKTLTKAPDDTILSKTTPSTLNPAIKTELQSPDGAVPKLGCPEGKHYDTKYQGCLSNISPLPNGKCVQGYHTVSSGTCEKDAIVQPTALGTCPTGFHLSKGLCYIDEIPDDDGKCVQGSHLVKNPKKNPALSCVKDGATLSPNDDRSCPLGYHLITLGPPSADPDPSLLCVEDKNTLSTQQSPTKQPNNVAGGGASTGPTQTTPPQQPPSLKQTGGTTPTGGGTTTTATTPSPSPTTTTTVVNNNNRGNPSTSSSGGGGSSSSGSTGGTTQTSINFLTYVNSPNKITIKYPDTWTKTESLGDSRIPVMFNAPIADSTAAMAKTSFMIMINKLNSPTLTLDAYTQQQIDGLTHSKTVKYIITDTNAKVLTPPNGVSAYHEVSYDGIKGIDAAISAGGVDSSQASIPLKGTAIFFVNGDTGYSLLYLAKQTDYDSSLPIIQQMVNSFQIGDGGSSSASSSGAGVQNIVSSSQK